MTIFKTDPGFRGPKQPWLEIGDKYGRLTVLEEIVICNDSRKAFPQALFIAKRGEKYDGNQFIAKAIEAGASAILTDLYDPFLKNVTQIISKEIVRLEADLADVFFETPSMIFPARTAVVVRASPARSLVFIVDSTSV